MKYQILGVVVMALQLTSAHGINYKRLEQEADTYHHRIWLNTPHPAKALKRSLVFLTDTDLVERRYTKPEKFLKLLVKANREIPNPSFYQFSKTCKEVFESSEDRHKAAVYILLETVREKSLRYLKTLKRVEEFKRVEDRTVRAKGADQALEYFLNIDK